jgi:hypothetical protein
MSNPRWKYAIGVFFPQSPTCRDKFAWLIDCPDFCGHRPGTARAPLRSSGRQRSAVVGSGRQRSAKMGLSLSAPQERHSIHRCRRRRLSGANKRKAFDGRAQVIIQVARHPGPITLNAHAEGLPYAQLAIDAPGYSVSTSRHIKGAQKAYEERTTESWAVVRKAANASNPTNRMARGGPDVLLP